MSDEQAIEQAALELRTAYDSGPVPPIAPRLIPNTVAAGYAVQAVNTRHWLAAGRRAVGVKIGLTSQAVRDQIGVDQPDFGILFADMEASDGAVIAMGQMLQPRVEAEIAFGIAQQLSNPDLTHEELVAATAWVAPAIEIVASRITEWRCAIADTVADNASAGMFVVGERHAVSDTLDLPALAMQLTANGQIASEGIGAASLGDPWDAMLWLARTFADLGQPLQAGDIVLSGALGPLVAVAPDTEYVVRIEELGSVSVRFIA